VSIKPKMLLWPDSGEWGGSVRAAGGDDQMSPPVRVCDPMCGLLIVGSAKKPLHESGVTLRRNSANHFESARPEVYESLNFKQIISTGSTGA